MNRLKDSDVRKYITIIILILIFETILTIINFMSDIDNTVKMITLTHLILFFIYAIFACRNENILENSAIVVLLSVTFVIYSIFLSERALINLLLLLLVLVLANFYSSHFWNWASFVVVTSLFIFSAKADFMDVNYETSDLIYYTLIFLSISVVFTLNLNTHNQREEMLRRSKREVDEQKGEIEQVLIELEKSHVKIEQFSNAFNESISETSKSVLVMNMSFSEMKSTIEFQNENIQSIFENTKLNADKVESLSASSDRMLEETKQTKDMIESNKDNIIELKELMHTLNSDFKRTNDDMLELSKDVQNISDIMNVIDNISNSIKMLALNASIEAARAGEHGKGFKVVADEIKTLVTNTEASSKRISEVLDVMINKTLRLSERVNKSMSEIEKNTAFVTSLKSNFSTLFDKNELVFTEINNVTETSNSIKNSTNAVANNLSDFVSIIEESSASLTTLIVNFEEISATINNLSSSFKTMKEEVFH